jgi:hypothetical protein
MGLATARSEHCGFAQPIIIRRLLALLSQSYRFRFLEAFLTA